MVSKNANFFSKPPYICDGFSAVEKGRLAGAIFVDSFGLPCRKESSRIAQAVEAYPNRWTHHVAIETEKEIDDELMQWVDEAFQFSMFK